MPDILSSHELINNILKDYSASFWLKKAIAELLNRDLLDAARDAEVLHRIMEKRVKENFVKF